MKIETIYLNNNSVSCCPERGGLITSLKLKNKEVLFFDLESFYDTNVNVRGGIPILFPNAGMINGSLYPNLKQHGFARSSSEWEYVEKENHFIESLSSSIETKSLFPYEFKLGLEAFLNENNSVTFIQKVENVNLDKKLPISMGLHPYFKVDQNQKVNIEFNFEGGIFVKNSFDLWSNGKYVSIDNPKLRDLNATLEVVIPNLGTLILNISKEYKKIWVWSLPGKDFICIEPVMREVDGLVNNPELVDIRESYSAKLEISLK